MGGRKDDVARPQKPNRNRPLSAVLEEFELDDHDNKGNVIIITTSTSKNNNVVTKNDVNKNDVNANREGQDTTEPCDHSESPGDSQNDNQTQETITRGVSSLTSSQSSSIIRESEGSSDSCDGSPTRQNILKSLGTIEESPTIHRSGSITSIDESPRIQRSGSIKGIDDSPAQRTQRSGSVKSVGSSEDSPITPRRSSLLSLGSSGSESSPKSPRRGSLRGRRQALTPSLSPKFGRRGSSTFSARLASQNDVIPSDDDTLSPSDLMRVKQTTDRLHLSTRRPSVMQWREQYVECPKFPAQPNAENDDVTEQHGGGKDEEGRWTAERTQRINTALDWIKNELLEMRAQDQLLARQLLTIRSDIYQLKLARSCEEHQDMLDDVQSELEELQEFADVLDLPTPTITDSPLKHLGVTRMNFSARRFSTC